MSETINRTHFCGNSNDLKKLEIFIKDNYLFYDEWPRNNGNVLIAQIAPIPDGLDRIAQQFPDVEFVGYQFYCNCGEYDFSYSAKGSRYVGIVTPYSYEDDDDAYFDDGEENETDGLEEDEEDPWYEEIQNAVGVKALKALHDICQREGDVDMDIFDDIPDI